MKRRIALPCSFTTICFLAVLNGIWNINYYKVLAANESEVLDFRIESTEAYMKNVVDNLNVAAFEDADKIHRLNISSDKPEESHIVENLTVAAILNETIRLNISWTHKPDEQIKFVEIDLEAVNGESYDNRTCDSVYGIFNVNILENNYVVIPELDKPHPSYEIHHGCIYNVTMKSSDINYTKIQTVEYEIPKCIQKHCACSELEQSPYEIYINHISGAEYQVSWQRTEYPLYHKPVQIIFNLQELHGSKMMSYVNETVELASPFEGNSMTLHFNQLKQGERYRIVADVIENHYCNYFSAAEFEVKPQKPVIFISFCVVSILLFAIFTILFRKRLIKIFTLVNRRLPPALQLNTNDSPNTVTPLTEMTITKTRQNGRLEVNVQYIPVEFVTSTFDDFEFPRNKIVLGKQLGKGAFGVVYYASAYNLKGNGSYSVVAVKQLREGAPEEEEADFKAEIDILKRVGQHKNIVKLLGCCSLEKPYMMIMELVPGGALKDYLIRLRSKWMKKENNNNRHFFPDNMVIKWPEPQISRNILLQNMPEDWFDENNTRPLCPSASDGSYIIPETPLLPKSPFPCIVSETPLHPKSPLPLDSARPLITPNSPDNPSNYNKPDEVLEGEFIPNFNKRTSTSPTSTVTSSRLPSTTETLLTNLDLEAITPLTDDFVPVPEPKLDHTELQQFAYQIASGMAHLEKLQITHRDLAARNVLITEDKILKISDFGMSRTGPYVINKSKKFPLRWMAIEAIENKHWDSKSDVWSFGVVLWEIGTLGAFPYENIPDPLIIHNLQQGKRLNRPEICTDELYELMLQCWSNDPEKRPTFKELEDNLDVKKRRVYVDFSQIRPEYVFPPVK